MAVMKRHALESTHFRVTQRSRAGARACSLRCLFALLRTLGSMEPEHFALIDSVELGCAIIVSIAVSPLAAGPP